MPVLPTFELLRKDVIHNVVLDKKENKNMHISYFESAISAESGQPKGLPITQMKFSFAYL